MAASLPIGRIRRVITYPAEVLRTKCIPITDFSSPSTSVLGSVVADLLATVTSQNGLGLAAPQIGETKRVFVVRNPIAKTEQQARRILRPARRILALQKPTFSALINPIITERFIDDDEKKTTKKNFNDNDEEDNATAVGFEACLSLPDQPTLVRRYKRILVSYSTVTGERIENELLEGLPAVVFQHELDHLDGVLITDREVKILNGGRSSSGSSGSSNNNSNDNNNNGDERAKNMAMEVATRKFTLGLMKYYNNHGEIEASEKEAMAALLR